MKSALIAVIVGLVGSPAIAQVVVDPQTGSASTAGAVGAGVCAGAFDIYGQIMMNNGATAEELARIAFLRDAFSKLPEFDPAIIASNAESYVKTMGVKLGAATTEDARRGVALEVIQQASRCNTALRSRVGAQ